MTTSAPFTAAIEEMNGVMDEIEKALSKRPAGRARAPAAK
jgi:hypothetical protein